jgi:isopenicillin-N N-acyltransferase like protein
LAVRPLRKVMELVKKISADFGPAWPLMVQLCRGVFKEFPEPYRKEVEAMAKAANIDPDLLIVANTINEIKHLAGCSAMVVEAERSATGQPLVGRNWDFPSYGILHQYSLVVIHRPAGKRAFVDISFPGLLLCGTAMNDAGVVLAGNEIRASKDGATQFEPSGLCAAVVGRRVLEEMSSVAEVEKFARAHKSAALHTVIVCDPKGGAVLEITPKTVAVRRAEDGICAATNHFRCKELATNLTCRRYAVFEECRRGPKLGVKDVAAKMHAACQQTTMHALVLEPAALRIHLSLAPPPASSAPLRTLELGALFKKQ